MSEMPVGCGELDPNLSFRAALERIARAGQMLRAPDNLSVDYEIAGVLKSHDGDAAIWFSDVADQPLPVVGNVLASEPNCEAAFGADRWAIRRSISRGLAGAIPPQLVSDGPAREVVVLDPLDLAVELPALTHAPGDAGRFVTAGVVIVRHPDTGVVNASFHRFQLLGGNRVAIKIDLGRHLRSAYEAASARSEDLPICVAIGPDLPVLYAAAVMGSRMPEGKDELAAAGAIQGRPVEVLEGLTQDVLCPASAEIILEGTISTSETVHEGPFGEFMGYHSDEGPAPTVTFTAMTRRSDAVYHAINGAGRETVMLRKYVLEATALDVLQQSVPIVTDVNMTTGGMHRFHLNVAVRKTSDAHDGLQRNAALAAFGAMKDLARVVVVDDDIDVHSEVDVEYAIASRVEASRDLIVVPGARGHEYVRISDAGIASKWIVDATVPHAQQARFRRINFESDPRSTVLAPIGSIVGRPAAPAQLRPDPAADIT